MSEIPFFGTAKNSISLNRLKPIMVKKDALQRRLFCYFIGRQPYSEGTLFRAVHGVCHYFTEIFHLLSHSIFLPHFTTTISGLYHSRYGFWQIHFRHLVLHMRLLCNMIVDIHCDLCIRMAHDILHNFGIDVVLTQSGTSRMTKGMR